MKFYVYILSIFIFTTIFLMNLSVQAEEVHLAWDYPTPENGDESIPNFDGFRLYWGEASGQYTGKKEVDKEVLATTIANLDPGKTYYFAATSFDAQGNESVYSNEVSTTIPDDAAEIGILPITAVNASAAQAPNVAVNTLDGDLATRWAAEGDGQWIEYELAAPAMVSQVAIAWYQGDRRTASFSIEVSADGQTWTEVFSGDSSGTTQDLEVYTFAPAAARYVRIVGYGNSANTWSSILEVEMFGTVN